MNKKYSNNNKLLSCRKIRNKQKIDIDIIIPIQLYLKNFP